MVIVTGGAGFIGSALVWGLNKAGKSDILLVDDVDHNEKEHNIGGLSYEELVGIDDFHKRLLVGGYDQLEIEAVLHMGACANTMERRWNFLLKRNVEYSQDVIRWCTDRGVRCIYASSAAVYGDGKQGFTDNDDLFDYLKPLNLYGKSKLDVDIWARDSGYLDEVVGLRYFNVFGPNEAHKENMQSVIGRKYMQIEQEGSIGLFKSYRDDFEDGEQARDFVYIKDVVKVVLYFLEQKELSGIFNVGCGVARTWNSVAKAIFSALDRVGDIRYIEMPQELREQYQYRTVADIGKLRGIGFKCDFTPLEEAVSEYINEYLVPHQHLT